MSIVVTGSAGRVGSKMVNRLLDDGHRVTGFDIRSANLSHAEYREIIGPFHDRACADDAMRGADAVLHLGALMSWLPADSDELFRANVEGTRIILEAAAKVKPNRFVFASSGEVYPEGAPDYLPVDEDHPLTPRSAYGLTKLLGEELVRFFERTSGTPSVILRFSHTQDASELLDPASFFSGPRFFLEPKIRQQAAFGNKAAVEALSKYANGSEALVLSRNENGRAFQMHITETRDMLDGLMLAFRHDKAAGQTFNLGSTDPANFEIVLNKMADVTGLPLHTVDLPGPGVYYHTSNAKIRSQLGFEPLWTIDRMIEEAAKTRRTKLVS